MAARRINDRRLRSHEKIGGGDRDCESNDKQTDKRTERKRDRQTGGQTDRQIERQTDNEKERQTDRWTDRLRQASVTCTSYFVAARLKGDSRSVLTTYNAVNARSFSSVHGVLSLFLAGRSTSRPLYNNK